MSDSEKTKTVTRRKMMQSLLGAVGLSLIPETAHGLDLSVRQPDAAGKVAHSFGNISRLIATHDFVVAAVGSHTDMTTDKALSSKEWFAYLAKNGVHYQMVEGLQNYRAIAEDVYDSLRSGQPVMSKSDVIASLNDTQKANGRLNNTPPALDAEIVSNRADAIINAAEAGVRLLYVDDSQSIQTQRMKAYKAQFGQAFAAQSGKPGALGQREFQKQYEQDPAHKAAAALAAQDDKAGRESLLINNRFVLRALAQIGAYEKIDHPADPQAHPKIVVKFGDGHGPNLLESARLHQMKGAAVHFFESETVREERLHAPALTPMAKNFVLASPSITMDDGRWHESVKGSSATPPQNFQPIIPPPKP